MTLCARTYSETSTCSFLYFIMASRCASAVMPLACRLFDARRKLHSFLVGEFTAAANVHTYTYTPHARKYMDMMTSCVTQQLVVEVFLSNVI